MAFPDTLTNLRIYLDSKQNSGYTLRTVGADDFISSVPPVGTATLTGSQTTEAFQPKLTNDLVDIYDNSGDGPMLNFGDETNFDLGATASPSFTVGIKFIMPSGISNSGSILVNDAAARNFNLEIRADQSIILSVKGEDVWGGTSGVTVNWVEGANYFSMESDLSTNTGNIKFNGTDYDNVSLTGTDTRSGQDVFIGARKNGFISCADVQFEYFIGAQSSATSQQLTDLDLFLRDELGVLSQTIQVDGSAKSGVNVLWLEMDAITADTFATDVFTNTTVLGATQTDAQGVAQFTGAFDDTKVHLAVPADAVYRSSDGKWLFEGDFGLENIDLTAPA